MRRAIASVLSLAALVVGVPVVLVGVVGWPLPHGLPAIDEVRNALGDGWRPDSRFVLGVLGVLAWVVWAQLVRHLVAEARSQLQWRRTGSGLPTPVVPVGAGVSRRLAAWLVAGIVMAGPITAAVGASTRIPVVLAATQALAPPGDRAAARPTAPAPPQSSASYVVHTWEESRDCLWTIAERHLADPLRWHELLELNADVLQPSGRRLGDDPRHWVYPGMVLRLPATPGAPAAGAANGSQPPAAATPPAAVHAPAHGDAPDAAGRAPEVAVSAPTTSSPAARSQPGQHAPADRGAVRLGRNAMRVAQALALGLPLFAAGGLVAHLNRRRRLQVARHRPGRDIARPDPTLEPLERAVRSIAADQASDWVDATVRVLGARLRAAEMAPPVVTCVRAGQLGLEVLLADARPIAPPGFEAVDDGFVWRVAADADLDDLRAEAAAHTALTPALVSLGASPEGPLLVDLEGIGTLSVEGAPARVAAFLSGVALELATAPWAQGVDLRLVGPEPGLGSVDGVRVVQDTGSLAEQMAALGARAAEALGPGATTLAGRVAEAEEPWFPTVVVVGVGSAVVDLERMAAAARPGSGVVLVGPGPIAGAGWRLVVVDDGHARLEPLGLVVRAAGVTEGVESDVGSLDPEAIVGAAALVAAAAEDDDVALLVDITDAPPRPVATPRRRAQEVWVGVLGPVETSGWARSVGARSKFEEVVAYLATHPGPVRGEDLRAAAWPDTDMDPKSFREAMSRVRSHLGREAGHLPNARGGAYGLGDGVGCDWTWFLELSGAAAGAAPVEAMALWREALGLVRGQPFGGGLEPGRPYGWAYSEFLVYDMQREITQAADALAGLALANDDPDTTQWAVRQGHLATPGQLSLFDWEMRVARYRLDLDALKLARNSRRRAEQELDPGADLPPETIALYDRLVGEITGLIAGSHQAGVR